MLILFQLSEYAVYVQSLKARMEKMCIEPTFTLLTNKKIDHLKN